MANIRIITSNLYDIATLSASPAMATSLPVTNTQNALRSYVARTTSLADQAILGDWNGSVQTVTSFAILRHNLTSAATLRLRLYDGANQTGTVVYDSGSASLGDQILGWGAFQWGIDVWGPGLFTEWPVAYYTLWFATCSALSFRLEMSDPINPDGYMEIGRIFCGLYFEPEFNVSHGASVEWADSSRQARTEGGSLRTENIESYRRWKFSLAVLSETERAIITDIFRSTGLKSDFFISAFPGRGGEIERDFSGQAKIVQIPAVSCEHYQIWKTDLILEEA
jgi:hypothetical protein